ncbi:MAG: hypothetical protein ACRDPH_17025 [Marmoricola sp.]
MRKLVIAVVVLAVAAVAIAIARGVGPFPEPEGCHAVVQGHQVDVDLGQGRTATLISAIAVKRGLPARAASIALATGFQESKLRNLSSGDRDSAGIFQQRPSQGWGTRAQVMDPYYAINAFYDALHKIHGYREMRITEAAQLVQRSGYPEAYEAHAPDARALASALTGYSTGGRFSCVVHDSGGHGSAAPVARALARAYGVMDTRPGHGRLVVRLPPGEGGNRLGWSVAQFLVAHAKTLHLHRVQYAHKSWRIGSASEKGWTHASGTGHRVLVTLA